LHGLLGDGSCKRRAVPPCLTGDDLLQATLNSDCSGNHMPSLKTQKSSRAGALVPNAVSLSLTLRPVSHLNNIL
jgi:hypothetical protein